MDTEINVETLKLSNGAGEIGTPASPRFSIYKPSKGEKFLKGPMPWAWLQRAASAPGKALHIAIAIWFFAGMNRRRTVGMNLSRLSDLGISRDAARRGLGALERAGLVFVQRHAGRKPLVTILIHEGASKANAAAEDERDSTDLSSVDS